MNEMIRADIYICPRCDDFRIDDWEWLCDCVGDES